MGTNLHQFKTQITLDQHRRHFSCHRGHRARKAQHLTFNTQRSRRKRRPILFWASSVSSTFLCDLCGKESVIGRAHQVAVLF